MTLSLSPRSTAERRGLQHALPLSSPAGAVTPTPHRPGPKPHRLRAPQNSVLPIHRSGAGPATSTWIGWPTDRDLCLAEDPHYTLLQRVLIGLKHL
jgi:hypothetical protein